MTLLYGIIIGTALAFVFGYGVSFFAMMQASAQHGFRSTLPFVGGIILSDAVMVYLMVAVMASWIGYDKLAEFISTPWVLSIGIAVMVAMGVYTIMLKPKRRKPSADNITTPSTITYSPRWQIVFSRGFALNFFNPLVWLFWLSVVIVIAPLMDTRPESDVYVLFTGVMLAELGCNVLKCWLSAFLQRLLSDKVLNIFNKIIGVILIGFAFYILFAMLIFKDRQPETPKATTPSTVIMGVMPPGLTADSNHQTKDSTTSLFSL